MQTLKVSEVYSSSDNDSLNHSSNSSVASDIVDSIDLANKLPLIVNCAKVFLVALRLKLAPPMQGSEIIGKWFAGIYTVGKRFCYMLGRSSKGFCLTVTANKQILN